MAELVDAARPLEGPDPALDPARLRAWLAQVCGEDPGPLELARYPRGFSNLTYRVRCAAGDWVLRRPPAGVQIAQAHDMTREARVLAAVGATWDRVPAVIATCEDPAVLGAPFFLMQRVEGLILRDRPPPGLELGPATMRRLSEALADALADIHGLDLGPAGQALGRPEGYAARQVEGWTRRYAAARTEDVPDVDRMAAWLHEHLPPPSGVGLLHNDLKYDNLVLDPQDPPRIRAVLDWEMATRGDPLLDLGSTLAYWVQADDPPALQMLRLGLSDLPGNLTRMGLVARYRERTGRPDFDPLWPYVYGLFKLVVVAQQLHARFVRGLTTEPRYELAIWAVRGLSELGLRAIARRRIEDLGG